LTKLAVDVVDVGEERVVQLTQQVVVVGEEVESVVRGPGRARTGLPLHQLLAEYELKFGHGLPLARLGVTGPKEAVDLLYSWAQAALGTGPGPTVAAFSGRGFDMLRLVMPGQVARSHATLLQYKDRSIDLHV
jgi:hypothetical protein